MKGKCWKYLGNKCACIKISLNILRNTKNYMCDLEQLQSNVVWTAKV